MNKEFVLSIDIGTSSVRAGLYDFRAEAVPESFIKHERTLSATDDGGAEIDADEAFAQVEEAIADAIGKSAGRSIRIVAISSFWHSILGIDADGNPTTKVFAWAENRPAKYIETLRRDLDPIATHNRTGAHFHSSFWPAKLLWLKSESPTDYARTSQWISFSDYVGMRVCGSTATSVSMASATGLFDQRLCEWDRELCDYLKLGRSRLPRIAADAESLKLGTQFSAKWPQLADADWFPAIGDGAANNIGAGCVGAGKAALMIGTSGAMRVVFEGDVPQTIPDGLWSYRIDGSRVIIGGALSDGGGLYRWMKDNLRLTGTDDEIESEIANRPPAAHQLSFLPFFFGERSTGYHENATGAIIGLRSTSDAIDIVQAGLESVAYRFAEIFDRLDSVNPITSIVASGGALRESPVWTQIIADVIGRDLFLPETREASSRGAAIYALQIAGAKVSSAEAAGRVFQFDRERHQLYDEARRRHRETYRSTVG